MTQDEIKDEIIKKQDEYIQWVKKYYFPYPNNPLEQELASLKAELEKEIVESSPHIDCGECLPYINSDGFCSICGRLYVSPAKGID